MSGLAIFGLKFPSLLQFEKQAADEPWIRRNLRTLYRVDKAPSDTCLRERLDEISPRQLRRPFKQIFAYLQRGKALEKFRYLDGHHIISLDGTGQYSSKKVHCKSLSLLDSLNMQYVIGVKPGDHNYLFDWIKDLPGETHIEETEDGSTHSFQYYTDVPLNEAKYDYRVNVLEYTETKKNGKTQKFSWVTKLKISPENVYEIMRAGRSRWKIENETFNTLKNQGYNFEHNYGHGYSNLCCKVYQHVRTGEKGGLAFQG